MRKKFLQIKSKKIIKNIGKFLENPPNTGQLNDFLSSKIKKKIPRKVSY